MDAKGTLYDLYLDADRWHARLAAWIGRHPKTAATTGLVAAALGLLKVIDIAAWVL